MPLASSLSSPRFLRTASADPWYLQYNGSTTTDASVECFVVQITVARRGAVGAWAAELPAVQAARACCLPLHWIGMAPGSLSCPALASQLCSCSCAPQPDKTALPPQDRPLAPRRLPAHHSRSVTVCCAASTSTHACWSGAPSFMGGQGCERERGRKLVGSCTGSTCQARAWATLVGWSAGPVGKALQP